MPQSCFIRENPNGLSGENPAVSPFFLFLISVAVTLMLVTIPAMATDTVNNDAMAAEATSPLNEPANGTDTVSPSVAMKIFDKSYQYQQAMSLYQFDKATPGVQDPDLAGDNPTILGVSENPASQDSGPVPSAGPAPIAGFTGTPRSGVIPLTVTFSDTSTGNPTSRAWFFGDESYSQPWIKQTNNAGFWSRSAHTSVVMPDGSIVMIGGWSQGSPGNPIKNDVWRSTDNGKTWNRQAASAPWLPRFLHTSVVMPDGSIVLMGGSGDSSAYNDVWLSKDYGKSWIQQTAAAPWSTRAAPASVVMPDGSIVLMGGNGPNNQYMNNVWSSQDSGKTWVQQTTSAAWQGRIGLTSVAMPDGSIVLVGGRIASERGGDRILNYIDVDDAWRVSFAGSTEKNPTHTYTKPQTFRVSFITANNNGKSTTSSKDFITTMVWKKIFGGSGNDFGKVSIPTRDGGLLIVGETKSSDGDIPQRKFPGGQEIVVAKYGLNSNSLEGTFEWSKTYGGSKTDEANYVLELDDGYLVIGTTYSNDGDVSGNHGGESGTADVWIFKIDLKGNLIWQKCYGGSETDKGMAAAIESDSSGKDKYYVVTGWTESNDGDVSGRHNPGDSYSDAWTFAINASGDHDIVWQRCYGGSSEDRSLYIEESRDGKNWIIAGYTTSNDGDLQGKRKTHDEDAWIFSIPRDDSTHQIDPIFNRIFGGSGDDAVRAIQLATAEEGGYIATGYTSSNDGDVKQHYGPAGSKDLWVLKSADDGLLEWEKSFGGSKDDDGEAIRVWPSRSAYYILGSTESNDFDVEGINHGGNSGTTDIFLLKLDYSGNLLSSHCYGGSSDDNGVRFGDRSSDNHAYITGDSSSNDGDLENMNHGGYDIVVFQLA